MKNNWLKQASKETGSKQAHQGARQMAGVVAEFFLELEAAGVPNEQAGIITAEFARVIVGKTMGKHERKTE